MTNIFEETTAKIKNSKIVMWIFLMALTMLVVGLNHFIEDTLSSFYGIKMLEGELGMQPASYAFTYFTMSVAPQVAQVVFTYMFLVDTDRYRWASLGALGALLVDFVADTWYRSNAQMFDSPVAFLASVVLTLVYFTVGSELFITIGLGIVLELFSPAFKQFKVFFNEAMDAVFSNKKRGSYTPQQPVKPPQVRPPQPTPHGYQRIEKERGNTKF